MIAHNPDHQATALTADFAAQVKLDVYRAPTDRAEAEYVVHQVERMVGGTSYFSLDSGRVEDDGLTETHTFGDFAVLYRLNAQARLLEEAFDRSGIPYQATGGSALAEQQPVREILSLLWLTQLPASRLHWWRLLARGPGAARESGLEEVVARIASDTTAEPYRAAILSPSEARAAHGLELVRSLAAAGQASVSELVGTAAAGWAELRGRAYDAAELERVARLERRAVAAGTGMRGFLTAAALQSETDRYDERADRVVLMSLHAAKGLEFPVVFITGCEEGLLPYLPPNRAADPAEERRLFYVGMTRARRRLILTHAARRLVFGKTVENPLSASSPTSRPRCASCARPRGAPPTPRPTTCSSHCSESATVTPERGKVESAESNGGIVARSCLRFAEQGGRSLRGISDGLTRCCGRPPHPRSFVRDPDRRPRHVVEQVRRSISSLTCTSRRTSPHLQLLGRSKPASTQVSISSQAFSARNIRGGLPNSCSIAARRRRREVSPSRSTHRMNRSVIPSYCSTTSASRSDFSASSTPPSRGSVSTVTVARRSRDRNSRWNRGLRTYWS